ncbi:MAG TPA: alpha-1,4-glucan--maltose-1-phosphate maltosyltransferase [Sphingomonadaceae bacterium]
MPQPLCLVSARPPAEEGGLGDLLELARKLGFDGLVWESDSGLLAGSPLVPAAVAEACRAAGLRLIAQLDLRRVPVDHPLVRACPERFRIQRAAQRGPVDPRRPLPPSGEALARLAEGDGGKVAEALAQRIAELPRERLDGLRLVGAERIAPDTLGRLLEPTRREDGFLVLAGPLFGHRELAAPFARAGVDRLVTSFAWWDFHAPWLVEEAEALRAAAPLLAELGEAAGPGELARRAQAAAASASGFIAPLECLARGPDAQSALARAVEIAARAAAFSGEMRQVSSGAAPVTVLARADANDARLARHSLLVAINTDAGEAHRPASSVLEHLGSVPDPADLAGFLAPLEPCEVRVISARSGTPVEQPPHAAIEAAGRPRLVVEDIVPRVGGGDFAVKRVVGETVTVEATIFADGHEQLAAELRWRAEDEQAWRSVPMEQLPNDRWRAAFPLERLGRHKFVVEGWLDRFGGFQRDLAKKLAAEVAQPVDHAEGRLLVEAAAKRCKGEAKAGLKEFRERLKQAEDEMSAELLLDDRLAALMRSADERPHRHASLPQIVDAERLAARFSSWYELFPRSQTQDKARHGTFIDVIGELPRVRAMGFDTLYFPPIHPIGRTNRKGPNNTLTPGPDDPGSPYAIGGAEGGHDAIHPELGSFEDFDRLVRAAHEHGIEIALDFAIQASPDHPWLTEHPGWFAWRPDGSMKYAENPPKKYQDIVNVDFYAPDAVPALWEALRDVVLLWIAHGVKTFRVDNPHTKPLPFWEWLIRDVRSRHPEAIFLSEAFTRPTMMYRLAKIGFSQSYTYFTWRDRKQELVDYLTELTATEVKEFYRPNFFVNTPDINPFFLQQSGRPGFRIRAVLAATLSGLWGVYSGFELCESAPLGPGKEEYLDSEKYEIRPRPARAPGDIVDDIALLNRLRRAHPALQTHLNTRFYVAHNDSIIWYGKPAPEGGEIVMVMVNLDPHNPQEADFEVPLWEFGLADDGTLSVEDLALGGQFEWHGKIQRIRLEPAEPYRIWRLTLPKGERA